ncbi:MAG TPA: phosphomannomutase/phosphoglucomutase [Patescibacteria group bacterium]|nr:phosphomannomutase/phosphoglucomutase [Patescibacteria group bacterium]
MNINQKIFKAYDIRGIVPEELNEQIAERVGMAFVKLLEEEGICPKTVVASRDMRTSSLELFEALSKGIASMGVDVIDIGQSSTDMFYFACGTLNLPGIAITASHNPKQYNGFKMIKQMPYAIGKGQGMERIQELAMSGDLASIGDKTGTITQKDVREEFIKKILSFIDVSRIKPLKVVIDCGNGMAGPYIEHLEKFLPIKIIPMYFEPDGTFPNHPADPLEKANRAELEKRAVTEGGDLGIAFDGDVDRCFFIDDTGEFVSGDFLTAVLAERFLKKFPGGKIIYDLRASDVVPDTVEKLGGRPLINRVGHAYIKRRMIEEGAIFAGEVTGHYYFKNFFNADSGLIPALLILEMLSEENKKFSEILKPLREKYFISGEINSKVNDVKAVLQKIETIYKAGEIEKIDGISARFADWHFNVRGSNTEPLIRLNLEAKTKEMMQEKRDEVLEVIRG